MVMVERLAAFTFRSVVPLTPSKTAWILVLPRFLAVAIPTEVIDATVLLEEFQITLLEMSLVVP